MSGFADRYLTVRTTHHARFALAKVGSLIDITKLFIYNFNVHNVVAFSSMAMLPVV